MIGTLEDRTDDLIDRALATPGGHLSIGRGGFVLHYAEGSTLSGYACEDIKRVCIARGLPVIDSRMVPFPAVWDLAVKGPMIAVGREPHAAPWGALSYAPLQAVAGAYHAAGAEVFNIDLHENAQPADLTEVTA
jgi:hypothetical protein